MRSRPLVGQAHGVVLFPHLQHGNRNLNECIIWPCQLPIMFFCGDSWLSQWGTVADVVVNGENTG